MSAWSRLFACGLILVTAITGAAAQEPAQRESEFEHLDGYGLMLSPVVMERLLDRISEKMANDLQFDEAQADEARRIFKGRVLRFVRDNQKEMTQLANEFLEKRLDVNPPTPEDVADWAQRALPMLEKTKDLVSSVSEEMRPIMSDEQQVKMDASLAAFEVGTNFVGRRLQTWSDGGFDVATDWYRSPGVQKLDRERARELERAVQDAREAKLAVLNGQAPDLPPTEGAEAVVPVSSTDSPPAAPPARAAKPTIPAAPAAPKDEWTLYVESFIVRYSLDSNQQQKAMVHLNSARSQRDNFLRGKGRQMEEMEQSFKAAKSPEQIKAAEERYQTLMKPVDRMFEILKEKLDALPTREQRRNAAPAQAESTPKAVDGATRVATDKKP